MADDEKNLVLMAEIEAKDSLKAKVDDEKAKRKQLKDQIAELEH